MTRLRIKNREGEQLNTDCYEVVIKGGTTKVELSEKSYDKLYDACLRMLVDEPEVVSRDGSIVVALLPDFDADTEVRVLDSLY